MEWREVVEHPSLKDLPFKIETNKWGKIMMTPASDLHGIYQSHIVRALGTLAEEGETATECPIQTCEGVRVADVPGEAMHFLKNTESATLRSPKHRKS